MVPPAFVRPLLRLLHGRPQLGDALRVVVAGRRRVLGPAAQPLGQVIRHPRLAQPGAERVPPRVERVGLDIDLRFLQDVREAAGQQKTANSLRIHGFLKKSNGGVDGIRTRDHRIDSPVR